MDQLKQISLTEEDFKLIGKALDTLPSADNISTILTEAAVDNLSKGMPTFAKEKLDAQWKKFKVDEQMKRESEKEEIKILQGKLILLKRALIENNLMGKVNDILNK
jgi:hypothetical protein